MMRLIAYLLFGLGIAAAIVGGAKLPTRQVEYLQEQKVFQIEIASLTTKIGENDARIKNEKLKAGDVQRKQLDVASKEHKDQIKVLKAAIKNVSGWPPESTGARFSNSVPVFCVGVGIAIVGIVLWRNDIRDRRNLAKSEEENQRAADDSGEMRGPAAYIYSLQPAMVHLVSSPDRRAAIDAILAEHVTPFVEQRDRLIDEMGLSRAAPVLLQMARGERLLNRAWSAEADGHRPESLDAASEAQEAFEDALAVFEEKEA
jgi:hypothetical protein